MSAAVAGPILREDDRGIPRSLPLLAALVEAESRRCAAAASSSSRPAETGLVRAFRGGTTPKVPIRIFMERIHLLTRSVPASRGMTRIDGTSFVLAGIYLTRFIRSYAGREAGILVEPATAHRLVAVALFLGAKFGGHPPKKWIGVFQASSEGAIRAGEMPGLEGRFLRAIDFRLYVETGEFDSFCLVLERGPRAPSGGSGSGGSGSVGCARPPARRGRRTPRPERMSAAASELACRHLRSCPIRYKARSRNVVVQVLRWRRCRPVSDQGSASACWSWRRVAASRRCPWRRRRGPVSDQGSAAPH